MPEFDVEELRRREFPDLDGAAYLNAASYTPLPRRSVEVLADWNERRAAVHRLLEEDIVADLHRARERAAALIGADPAEIALGGNTSYGINLAAQCLPVRPGSTVVVSDREFPSNVYPWMRMEGTRLEVVPTDARGWPDEERLLERLARGDVALFALSSVQFATGYHADLERFGRACAEQGVLFVVDAIQSLGQLPMDVRRLGVDVLATGGHKWLCSPFGTGFAYVRRELLERMEPRVVGWTGMEAASDLGSIVRYRWSPRADARRFEVSTLPAQDFAALAASLELLMEVGPEAIAAHLVAVLEPLMAWLRESPEVEIVSSLEPARRSGIFCFRPPSPEALHRRLAGAGVVCALREGAVRIAPHLYSTRAEVERVVDILEENRKGGWS